MKDTEYFSVEKTRTLVSLAILKVDMDNNISDYLGYLVRFVSQIIVKHKPGTINEEIISEYFSQEFV